MMEEAMELPELDDLDVQTRIALEFDSRLAQVWATLFRLDSDDLSDGLGGLLRMAYLRGYEDALCEPVRGELFRKFGMPVPGTQKTGPQRKRKGGRG